MNNWTKLCDRYFQRLNWINENIKNYVWVILTVYQCMNTAPSCPLLCPLSKSCTHSVRVYKTNENNSMTETLSALISKPMRWLETNMVNSSYLEKKLIPHDIFKVKFISCCCIAAINLPLQLIWMQWSKLIWSLKMLSRVERSNYFLECSYEYLRSALTSICGVLPRVSEECSHEYLRSAATSQCAVMDEPSVAIVPKTARRFIR